MSQFPLEGKVPLLNIRILTVRVLVLRLKQDARDGTSASVVDRHIRDGRELPS